MKKESTRDYITAAFRFYALRSGQEPEKINSPEYFDHIAVRLMFETLERERKEHIACAVKAVYFAQPNKPLRNNEISERVSRFAVNWPTDERTVYRWLKTARELCASFRGLRL